MPSAFKSSRAQWAELCGGRWCLAQEGLWGGWGSLDEGTGQGLLGPSLLIPHSVAESSRESLWEGRLQEQVQNGSSLTCRHWEVWVGRAQCTA